MDVLEDLLEDLAVALAGRAGVGLQVREVVARRPGRGCTSGPRRCRTRRRIAAHDDRANVGVARELQARALRKLLRGRHVERVEALPPVDR